MADSSSEFETAQEKILNTEVSTLLPKDRDIVSIKTDTSIEGALETLSFYKILSAPCYSAEERKHIALVDLLDIVGFFATNFGATEADEENDPKVDYQAMTMDGFLATEVQELIGISNWNPFVPVKEDTTVGVIMKQFTFDLQRVVVMNKKDRITGVISQSSLIRYLGDRLDVIGSDADMTVADHELLIEDVETITGDTEAKEAFETLFWDRLLGLAVVDKDGRLVDNLSVSDLKGLSKETWKNLNLPVSKYLKKTKGQHKLFSCSEKTTLREVITMFNVHGVHRLYVVDATTGAPTASISLQVTIERILNLLGGE